MSHPDLSLNKTWNDAGLRIENGVVKLINERQEIQDMFIRLTDILEQAKKISISYEK